MFTDAHYHPFDLEKVFPGGESPRRNMGVAAAASATSAEEFAHNEQLSRKAVMDNAAPLLCCFALHPQLPKYWAERGVRACQNGQSITELKDGLALLEKLAAEKRLAAVGETGFDLYNAAFRETEKIQDELFAAHLEIALRFDLPLVLHVRRAMHKIFASAAKLKKCRSVIFHSWSGTLGEGESLLKRGINAYFSFGTTILLNHREAMRCCAAFPRDRLLTETDAPYQPLRGKAFSSCEDLPRIAEAAAALRGGEADIEKIICNNFFMAFSQPPPS